MSVYAPESGIAPNPCVDVPNQLIYSITVAPKETETALESFEENRCIATPPGADFISESFQVGNVHLPDEVLMRILEFCDKQTLLNLLKFSDADVGVSNGVGKFSSSSSQLFGGVFKNIERFVFEETIQDIIYPEKKLVHAVESDNPTRILRGLLKNSFFENDDFHAKHPFCAQSNTYTRGLGRNISGRCEFEDEESQDILELCCKKGSLRILQWIYSRTNGFRTYYDFLAGFNKCLVNQNSSSMHSTEWKCPPFDIRLFNIAAAYGHLHVIEWLQSIFPPPSNDKSKSTSGSLSISSLPSCSSSTTSSSPHEAPFLPVVCTADAMDYAAKRGHLPVVKYLHAQRHEGCTVNAMNWAAESGHLEMVKWLHYRRSEGCSEHALRNAAGNDHLPVVEWLTTCRPDDRCSTSAMDWACGKGHLRIVQWLYQHRTEGCSDDAMYLAAGNGHLEVLRFLWEQMGVEEEEKKKKEKEEEEMGKGGVDGCVHCSAYVMDNAAAHGHLDVVQWLHRTVPGVRCTTDAIDRAASNGHLGMVQWLAAHRTEGATCDAMNGAAEHGHLDVVVWLDENGVGKGCTSYAMDRAAENGHLNVVQWLDRVRKATCTKTAMNAACANGHVGVCDYLFKNRREGCSKRGLCDAVGNGRLESVKWLFEHYLTALVLEYGGLRELLQDAANSAAMYGHLDVLVWLLTGGMVSATRGTRTHTVRGGSENADSIGIVSSRRLARLSSRIVGSAVHNGHVHILHWLRTHLRVDYLKCVQQLIIDERQTVPSTATSWRRTRTTTAATTSLSSSTASPISAVDREMAEAAFGHVDMNTSPLSASSVKAQDYDVMKETVVVARRRSCVSSQD